MCGLSEDEFKKMDVRKYNCYMEAYIRRRELAMQDQAAVGHQLCGRTADAVWGNNDRFNKPIKARLRPETRYDKLADSCNEMNLKKEDVLKRLRKELSKNGKR